MVHKRIIAVLVLGIFFCMPVLGHAQSLTSPNFEIDALGFIPSDTSSDFLPPVITQGPSASSITGTSAVIQWVTDIPTNSIVAFGLNASYGTEIGQSEERVKNHSVKLVGLSPSATYHYQAKSSDAFGRIGRSEDKTLTTTRQANISEVQISDINLTSVIISWKTATLTSSSLSYGLTTDYGKEISDESAGSTTKHTVRLSDLTPGTTYHFQIIGRDADGQAVASDDYIFTTQALPNISNFSVSNITGTTAEIAWDTNIPTDSFVSFWKVGEDESSAITQGSPDLVTKHRVVVTGLVGQTAYNFKILGRDGNGNKAQTPALSFKTPLDTTPPVITDVKSEISTSAKDDRLQLVVSWNTDEPATSQLEYNIGAPGATYSLHTQEDSLLTVNHLMILNGLKPSTNYHFRIKSTDVASNTAFGDDNSILTPQRQKSLLQIVLEKLEETFGWLRRVKF